MRLPRYIDRPGEDLAAKCRRLLGEMDASCNRRMTPDAKAQIMNYQIRPAPMPETEVIGGPAEHVGPLVENVYWWQRD